MKLVIYPEAKSHSEQFVVKNLREKMYELKCTWKEVARMRPVRRWLLCRPFSYKNVSDYI